MSKGKSKCISCGESKGFSYDVFTSGIIEIVVESNGNYNKKDEGVTYDDSFSATCNSCNGVYGLVSVLKKDFENLF